MYSHTGQSGPYANPRPRFGDIHAMALAIAPREYIRAAVQAWEGLKKRHDRLGQGQVMGTIGLGLGDTPDRLFEIDIIPSHSEHLTSSGAREQCYQKRRLHIGAGFFPEGLEEVGHFMRLHKTVTVLFGGQLYANGGILSDVHPHRRAKLNLLRMRATTRFAA